MTDFSVFNQTNDSIVLNIEAKPKDDPLYYDKDNEQAIAQVKFNLI